MRMKGCKKEVLLLFAGLVLTLGLWGCAGTTTQTPIKPASPSAQASQEVQRVSLEESKAAFDNGTALFLDVRAESSYIAGHIPGALSIPLAELEPRIVELGQDQWIITYCT
jgi:3-mercaptopyruvate sulfurtransferase SseA